VRIKSMFVAIVATIILSTLTIFAYDLLAKHEKQLEYAKLVNYLTGSLNKSMKVRLRIYKNGELVYEDPNDPISIQWLKLVANVLFGCYYMGCAQTWYDVDGNAHQFIDTEYGGTNPIPALAVGTGTTTSPSDYKLVNQVAIAQLNSNNVIVSDTGTSYNIKYRYTFDFSASYTISEAGLLLYVDVNLLGGRTNVYVLVAHDTFPGVSVAPGDTLSIEYEIVLDYSSPPFTRRFWQFLADYLLGLRGVGAPLSSYRMDLAVDLLSGGSIYDEVREKVYFAYVLADHSWNPDVSIPDTDLGEKWLPRKWVVHVYSTGISINATLITENTSETYSVYGIALFLCTDSDAGTWYRETYYLIAYVRLGNAPVTVDWTKWFYLNMNLSVS